MMCFSISVVHYLCKIVIPFLCLIFSSYLHCEWKTAEELERGDKRIHQKLKRYYMKKTQSQNMFSEVIVFNE